MTSRAPTAGAPRWAVLSLYRGGMAHFASGLANSLATADPEAAVAFFGPQPLPDGLFDPRVETHAFPLPETFAPHDAARWLRAPVTLVRLRNSLRRWQPTLIHINSGHWSYHLLIPALARIAPLIATLHDIEPHPGERRPHHDWKLNALLGAARRIVVNSEDLRRQALARWPLPPGKVVALPPPAFLHAAPPAPPDGAREHPADVLLFGRLYAYKGTDVLLRAWPRIAEQVPEARLTLAGAGDLSPWRAELETLGNRVRMFNRFLSEEETSLCFAETALVALPYRQASLSGVALLAAAHACAVVASRVGAIPETVEDGVTGLLVEPGDPAALAAAIVALLRDPERRRRMGRAALARARERGNPAFVGEKLLALYRDVLREA